MDNPNPAPPIELSQESDHEILYSEAISAVLNANEVTINGLRTLYDELFVHVVRMLKYIKRLSHIAG